MTKSIGAPFDLPIVPPAELTRRAVAFAERLRSDGLDGAFLLHPSSHFWISGTLGDGWPFVDADGGAFLPLRTSVGRARSESSLPLAPVQRPGDVPGALAELGAQVGTRVGLELDVVPVATLARLQKAFPSVEFRDVSRAIREVRSIKSAYEVSWIEKAAAIVGDAMDRALPPRIRAGVREIELMAFLEGAMRAARHQGTIRLRRWNLEMHYGTVSSGASACYPCYFDGPDGLEALYPAVQQGGGERPIEPGVAIMVDVVGAAGGYLADRTRIFCVGDPAPELVQAHEFCREILSETVARVRPGAVPAAIFDEVSAIVERSPWADRFMGWGENRVRFLGHGIGIDLDELPVIAPRFELPLRAGQVIAIEPKVFLGELGGVGVENTYLVTADGPRNLTPGDEAIRVLPG